MIRTQVLKAYHVRSGTLQIFNCRYRNSKKTRIRRYVHFVGGTTGTHICGLGTAWEDSRYYRVRIHNFGSC